MSVLKLHNTNPLPVDDIFSGQYFLHSDRALSLNKEIFGSVILMYISNNNCHKKRSAYLNLVPYQSHFSTHLKRI